MAEMIHSLPSDIKSVIFSQLPVDSILACKFICKTWRTLIDELLNDPSFAATHTRRFLSSSPSPPAAADASSYSFLRREKSREKSSNDNDSKDWSIVSSCNGLVCLVRKRYDYLRLNVCICNPVTKEYVNLLPQFNLSPSDPEHFHLPVIDEITGTGFGYASRTEEYKFVRITSDTENLYVSVYTLGSGTWRMKKVDKKDSCHDLLMYGDVDNESETSPASGLLFNGALYWSTRTYVTKFIQIVSFDLEKEEFRIVPSPPPQSQSRLYVDKIIIGVLGGCFCLISTDCNDGSQDILVMNKNEDKEHYTWIKKFRIDPAMGMNITPPFSQELEAKIFSNYDYMKFVSYPRTRSSYLDHHLNNNNINSQKVDWFEILLPYMNRFEMIPYMRSLVSLKALGENNADVATRKRKRVDIYDPLTLLDSCRKYR